MTDKEMLKQMADLLADYTPTQGWLDRRLALLKQWQERETIDLHYKNDDREQKGMWAPGDYCCVCSQCKDKYYGDKRSTVCADCAYKEQPVEECEDYLPPCLHNPSEDVCVHEPPQACNDCAAYGYEFPKERQEAQAERPAEWQPQQGDVVMVRALDSSSKDWYIRVFVEMAHEFFKTCTCEGGSDVCSTWTECKPCPVLERVSMQPAKPSAETGGDSRTIEPLILSMKDNNCDRIIKAVDKINELVRRANGGQ